MEDWREKASRLRREGSFERTIEHLQELLGQYPDDPRVYYEIACTQDALGKESDAVPAYEKAIALGLSGQDLEGAYLGLGSTYRCLGDYANSQRVLEKGISLFPKNAALKVFSALTYYNLKNHARSMEILLKELVRTSGDEQIKAYSRALFFYSERLDEKFE